MPCYWKSLLAIFTVAVHPALVAPAIAQDESSHDTVQALYHAQVIIDGCDSLAAGFLADDVSDVVRGYIETSACLKAAIVSHLEPMFDPDTLTPAYAEWMLLGMAHPTAELYWFLWTSHKNCGCGEETEAVHAEAVVTLYKSLLRDVIYQRKAYGL